MGFDSLQAVFDEQVNDLRSAEEQLVQALPKMAGEHYEIAAYGTAATLADQLGNDHAHDALGQTLDEEETADKLLTKIATGGMFKAGVNQQAAR